MIYIITNKNNIKSPINRDRTGDPGITTILQSHALPAEL